MSIPHILSKNVPRYTSYPVITWWKNTIEEECEEIKNHLSCHPSDSADLYIHLPFCESLCTYCGCNKYITVNHGVELIYVKAILSEWKDKQKVCGIKKIQRLHLGGGTPTFFSPKNLESLLSNLLKNTPLHFGSVEAHPNYTSHEHLKVLFDHGFKKISLGVQDFSTNVQKAIHRIQSPEQTLNVIQNARRVGFSEINIDLVYGLPFQSLESIEQTMMNILKWKPDSISYFSYAHVPWKSKAQRGFDENDLPSAEIKQEMFGFIQNELTKNGYIEIGMDHFALPSSELARAKADGTLHRNFMGYVAGNEYPLLGLGCSSISDWKGLYYQNNPEWKKYAEHQEHNIFQPIRHHFLTSDDIRRKEKIMHLMCYGWMPLTENEISEYFININDFMDIQNEEWALWEGNHLKLTSKGKRLVRWIASRMDPYYISETKHEGVFSKL